MNILLIGIYDSNLNASVLNLDTMEQTLLEVDYQDDLQNIYDDDRSTDKMYIDEYGHYQFDYYYGLREKARSLNFDKLIICEDGGFTVWDFGE